MAGTGGFSGNKQCRSKGWKVALLAILLSAGLAACTSTGPSVEPAKATPTATTAGTAPAGLGKTALAGSTVTDSFGNADFYTTVSGDTPALVAASFGISEARLLEFNALRPQTQLSTSHVHH